VETEAAAVARGAEFIPQACFGLPSPGLKAIQTPRSRDSPFKIYQAGRIEPPQLAFFFLAGLLKSS
jgi:hypothetical protein